MKRSTSTRERIEVFYVSLSGSEKGFLFPVEGVGVEERGTSAVRSLEVKPLKRGKGELFSSEDCRTGTGSGRGE